MKPSTLYKKLQKLKAPVLEVCYNRDGSIVVSSGFENSWEFLDYYGEYRGGYPWISDKLEALAEKAGGFWEWENPECIKFYEL